MATPGCNDQANPSVFDQISYTPERDPFAPGLLDSLPHLPRKIVLLKASRIGDLINTTPAFRALKDALPEAELTLISLPMLRGIIERMPYIDRYLSFPGYPGLAEQFFDPARALSFFQEMQAEQFDLAIQIQGTGVYSNPFTLMLGARWTAGFIRENDPPGRLSAAMPWPTTGHEIHRNLALTEFLGAETTGLKPDFHLLPEDHQAASGWLESVPAPWFGIHTSARDRTRRWPAERFAEAAARLQEHHGGTVILLGEERDREELEHNAEAAGAPYLNLAGCTSIPVSGAIIHRLSVFLTNDTGPAHIAYAVGAPVVTIFGGGDPSRNGPIVPGPFRVLAFDVPCRPCETGDCPIGFHCLENIAVEEVVQTAEEVMR
jgi:ADP-heptose:LPS heptosyltransferase